MIKIRIEGNLISVRKFGGLSKKDDFLLSDFDGFKTSELFSGGGDVNEYLYLIKNNKKNIKISQAYHKNYSDLKVAIQSKVNDLGLENFSFLDEIKEIFS